MTNISQLSKLVRGSSFFYIIFLPIKLIKMKKISSPDKRTGARRKHRKCVKPERIEKVIPNNHSLTGLIIKASQR